MSDGVEATESAERPTAARPVSTARRIGAGTRVRSNWEQLFKFALVGASGYLVNLAVFALLVNALGMHHTPGAVGAFCVAVANNFHWNRRWTFSDSKATSRFQGVRFFSVSVVALAVNLVLLELMVGPFGLDPLISQAVAVAAATPVNFIGNKLWTFGSSSPSS